MSLLPKPPSHAGEEAIWQDVEFGAYAADMPLWRELAAEADGPVLELGAGSGRVALALAREGTPVIALERDPRLAAELERRATVAEGLTVIAADLADSGWPTLLERPAPLALAPLQVLQLLDAETRARALSQLGRALAPGGMLAAALVDEDTIGGAAPPSPPTPDMREVEGWLYASEPLWVQVSEDSLRMRRMRERVSPGGDLARRVHDDVLHRLAPDRLEQEGVAAGLRPLARRTIGAGEHEAGSIVVILERP